MHDITAKAFHAGVKTITDAIAAWDKAEIDVLAALLEALHEYCEAFDETAADYVDFADLPSADMPPDVDTGYPVWSIDTNGNMLVGDELNETMTLAEYREQQNAA